MSKDELIIKKNELINKKIERVSKTIELFIKHNGNISDIELAEELNKYGVETSSSTVGRDLTNNINKYYSYLNEKKYGISEVLDSQLEIIEYIKNKRTLNKLEGKKIGGKNSSVNNIATKDELGHFNGSKKRV